MGFFDTAPGTHWTELARALFMMYWLVPGSAFALIVVTLMSGQRRRRWYTMLAAAVLAFAVGPVVVFGSIFATLIFGWYAILPVACVGAGAFALDARRSRVATRHAGDYAS